MAQHLDAFDLESRLDVMILMHLVEQGYLYRSGNAISVLHMSLSAVVRKDLGLRPRALISCSARQTWTHIDNHGVFSIRQPVASQPLCSRWDVTTEHSLSAGDGSCTSGTAGFLLRVFV